MFSIPFLVSQTPSPVTLRLQLTTSLLLVSFQSFYLCSTAGETENETKQATSESSSAPFCASYFPPPSTTQGMFLTNPSFPGLGVVIYFPPFRHPMRFTALLQSGTAGRFGCRWRTSRVPTVQITTSHWSVGPAGTPTFFFGRPITHSSSAEVGASHCMEVHKVRRGRLLPAAFPALRVA